MKKKILTIEDEKDTTWLLKEYLEKEGYSAHITDDGFNGLQFARREKPHLIILDLMLPGLDRLEV